MEKIVAVARPIDLRVNMDSRQLGERCIAGWKHIVYAASEVSKAAFFFFCPVFIAIEQLSANKDGHC